MKPPVLEISNLSKSFHRRKAVDDLSFTVNEGEVFGFLGPNGAGKSTTIRLMLALIRPDAGDVHLFGNSVRRQRNRALGGVGALIEAPDFYGNLSARTNLRILARMEKLPAHRIEEVLEAVRLRDRGDDKVKSFSHGMKQRLGIAQALLSTPGLLVLDEPTTGLDPRGMKEVRLLIRDLAEQGMTIFLSSHLLHEVEQVCTHLAIINQGRLITKGQIADLMHQTNLFTTEIQATPLEKAERILKAEGFADGLQVADGVLKIRARSEQLPAVTRSLVEQQVEVQAVIPRSSLEDYFLSLTE